MREAKETQRVVQARYTPLKGRSRTVCSTAMLACTLLVFWAMAQSWATDFSSNSQASAKAQSSPKGQSDQALGDHGGEADRQTDILAHRKQAVAALCAAVETNAKYCRDWLKGGDFASLQKTAGSLALVVELLRVESDDDSWRSEIAALGETVANLLSAAREENADAATECLTDISAKGESLAQTTPELASQVVYPRRNDVARIMDLLSGTYADAKAALTFDEIDVAKREALVLWRTGEYLKTRSGRVDNWEDLSATFAQRALAAATMESTNADELRAALNLAYAQCENCHNRR